MPTDVDVAEVLQIEAADVAARAAQKYASDLAAYREGIRRSAAGGGRLQADEADRLIQASRALGISPERLSIDSTIMLRVTRLESEIESIMERNASRLEPLARLRAELEVAQAAWVKVRVECEQRLKAAEAEYNAKHNAVRQVESQRDERVDQQQAAVTALRNSSPYLFADVSAEQLRRLVSQ